MTDIEQRIIDEITLQSDSLDPNTTVFGPAARELLKRNRTYFSRRNSKEDLVLIAAGVSCLLIKEKRKPEFLTQRECVTLAESAQHPKLTYLQDQKKLRKRLLLCTEEEQVPFFNWVGDVTRLTSQQLRDLLPPGGWVYYRHNLRETVAAVAWSCDNLDCVHKLPPGLSPFKDLKLNSRVAKTVECASPLRVTFTDASKSNCREQTQLVVVSKLYLLFYIWKRLNFEECLAACRLPVAKGCPSGLPVDYFALFPKLRTWSSSDQGGKYWLSGFNLHPKPPLAVENIDLPIELIADPDGVIINPREGGRPVNSHCIYEGWENSAECQIITGFLKYKPGNRRACYEDNSWRLPTNAGVGEEVRELKRRRRRHWDYSGC